MYVDVEELVVIPVEQEGRPVRAPRKVGLFYVLNAQVTPVCERERGVK